VPGSAAISTSCVGEGFCDSSALRLCNTDAKDEQTVVVDAGLPPERLTFLIALLQRRMPSVAPLTVPTESGTSHGSQASPGQVTC